MADVPLMSNPMTTAGDVIYGGASGAPTRLAIGTAAQVLKVNAGATAPEWAAESGGSGVTTLVAKTADETVNGSAALQNDDALLFAVGANEKWQFELDLLYSSGTTPDLKVAFTVPAGCSVFWNLLGSRADNTFSGGSFLTSGSGSSIDIFGGGAGIANARYARLFGFVLNGATAGNLQFQWAQNTSNASDSVVHAGSALRAWQIA